MPPFVGRKRASSSPVPAAPPLKKAKISNSKPSKQATKAVPVSKVKKKVAPSLLGSDSDSSSLSDVDSDDFEDVSTSKGKGPARNDSDDDIEWEDTPAQATAPDFSNREFKAVNITVEKDEELMDYSMRPRTKKGPSKREKATRMLTHKMHVQFLLWHNAKRNSWLNDSQVHKILLRHLPSQISKEIDKWQRASGLVEAKDDDKVKKPKGKKWKANGERNERDWGRPSTKLDEGKPDMSSGDPLISLLKVMAAFWKKKYAITAPGLRKRGYGTRLGLRKDIESFRNDAHHPAKHGERITSLDDFRKIAEKCEGSRDVGAQLFTALLRAIGIETRMIASLQPAGFGFTKVEEMVPRRIIDPEEPEESSVEKKPTKKAKAPAKRQSKGGKAAPIDLDPESSLSSDDDSVVDMTPSMPKAKRPKYDMDLMFPVYWSEAISPITNRVLPVSAFNLENSVATSAELLMAFEPKGAKAEKTRQVMAYVVGFSSDFSAKEVTVRYLRKRLWPGKTKGFRVPIENIPVYDRYGEITRTAEYDWFKEILSLYSRLDKQRTDVDDIEDNGDLVPAEPEKKEVEGDTLQSLKSSKEFVIEKHLRREEALIEEAKPDRFFITGKGDKQEEVPVYKRTDVRRVMTAESWHKEGRRPKEGEAPMKLAPVRAVTLARKREAEEHLIRTGSKQMQGLYCQDQTDWIIPPPIKDGIIPKNSYGNIDCFVPSMVPKGAVHMPLKGTVRICKKLEIDFAEAVVGFEFGNKMAVPVIHGVVIAKENEQIVRDAWRVWNEEQRKKEETKMEKLVLEMWRKMVIGLRIRARVSEEYGLNAVRMDVADTNVDTGNSQEEAINIDEDDVDGGFMPETGDDFGGGFLMDHEDEPRAEEDFVMDVPAPQAQVDASALDVQLQDASQEYPTPQSERKDEIKEVDTVNQESEDFDMIGGGFLVDEEDPEDEPIQDRIPKVKSKTKVTASRARENPKTTPIKQNSSIRKTPSRSAKSQVKSIKSDAAEESGQDSAEDDQDLSDASELSLKKAKISPRQRRRAKPRKKAAKVEKVPSRLLRKESTVVTSPYFAQEND